MKKTQTSEIKKYMLNNDGITSKEAFDLFGATRLSGLIFQLKKQGYLIKTEPMEAKTRYGNKVIIAKYSFVDKNNPKGNIINENLC